MIVLCRQENKWGNEVTGPQLITSITHKLLAFQFVLFRSCM